jgi:hypothetical protein
MGSSLRYASPDYDLLTVMQKVEVITDALKRSLLAKEMICMKFCGKRVPTARNGLIYGASGSARLLGTPSTSLGSATDILRIL